MIAHAQEHVRALRQALRACLLCHPRRRRLLLLLKRGVLREAQLVVAVRVSLVEDPVGCGILHVERVSSN